MSDMPPMAPGWFADPYGRAVQRYWNGASWTPYIVDATGQQRSEEDASPAVPAPSASAQGQGIVIQNIVSSPPPQPQVMVGGFVSPAKSMGAAIALTIFFGPLGLLYASVVGGLVLLAATILTLGVGAIITWPASIIWAAIAVNNHNRNLMAVMAAPQPIHSRPIEHGPNPQLSGGWPPPPPNGPPGGPGSSY